MKRLTILAIGILLSLSTVYSQKTVSAKPKTEINNEITVTPKGVKAENAASVFSVFLGRCKQENYGELCSPQIDKELLESAIKVYNSYKGEAMILFPERKDYAQKYSELKGAASTLSENQYLFMAIKIDQSDRNNPIKNFGAYAVVSHDAKSGTYWIEEFGIGNGK